MKWGKQCFFGRIEIILSYMHSDLTKITLVSNVCLDFALVVIHVKYAHTNVNLLDCELVGPIVMHDPELISNVMLCLDVH